jgi:hypothetical protein
MCIKHTHNLLFQLDQIFSLQHIKKWHIINNFVELECLFIFYTHDILIFSLNCNKISLNIKLRVNFICVNFFVHINIKI